MVLNIQHIGHTRLKYCNLLKLLLNVSCQRLTGRHDVIPGLTRRGSPLPVKTVHTVMTMMGGREVQLCMC